MCVDVLKYVPSHFSRNPPPHPFHRYSLWTIYGKLTLQSTRNIIILRLCFRVDTLTKMAPLTSEWPTHFDFSSSKLSTKLDRQQIFLEHIALFPFWMSHNSDNGFFFIFFMNEYCQENLKLSQNFKTNFVVIKNIKISFWPAVSACKEPAQNALPFTCKRDVNFVNP